jgi:low affinity Fe/Cu permease
MQYNVLVGVIFFLMMFMLAIQFQLSDLNKKMRETIRKVDELLNERLKEKKSNLKFHDTPV